MNSFKNDNLHFIVGEMVVGGTPQMATTILGSCVSVCLFDPYLKIGGVNHYLLPYDMKNLNRKNPAAIGEHSLPILLEKLIKSGANRNNLIAKAFGGGECMGLTHQKVGQRNAEFAESWLREMDIPLVEKDFGGRYSRKLKFMLNTGQATCIKTLERFTV